eukprot:TRINITY_DN25328_c0_g1_i1.p1 TRINITY_DN25328_c0_g1~~TRINITY_DN25328_c0_g1_i1.p1  ORF type:complete len:104 (+),score=3.54 TRINITY_DN25328_c0_g1_i1:29-313(+)
MSALCSRVEYATSMFIRSPAVRAAPSASMSGGARKIYISHKRKVLQNQRQAERWANYRKLAAESAVPIEITKEEPTEQQSASNKGSTKEVPPKA